MAYTLADLLQYMYLADYSFDLEALRPVLRALEEQNILETLLRIDNDPALPAVRNWVRERWGRSLDSGAVCSLIDLVATDLDVDEATARGTTLARALEILRRPATPPPEPGPSPAPASTKARPVQRDPEDLVLGKLNEHHRYAGQFTAQPHIGLRELARLVKIPPSTVGDVFKKLFNGHEEYKRLCRHPDVLHMRFRLINRDFQELASLREE